MKSIVLISTIAFAINSWLDFPSDQAADSSWEGTYTTEEGELKISNVTDKDFTFSISVANEECTGEIGKAKTTAVIKGAYNAVYIDGECKLTFQFDGKNTISILENECDLYHGMMCSFEGSYKRK